MDSIEDEILVASDEEVTDIDPEVIDDSSSEDDDLIDHTDPTVNLTENYRSKSGIQWKKVSDIRTRGRRNSCNVLRNRPGSKVTNFQTKLELFHHFFDK